MIIEVYSCGACGQVRLRMLPGPAPTIDRRGLVCGGEGLERANGGQTHEWTKMTAAGFFRLEAAAT